MVSTWKIMETEDHLNQAIKDSYSKTVVIFKHSVTCGISARAHHLLENEWNFANEDFDFYYLDLLSFRNISNQIASELKVQHQSPQIIIIKNGQSAYDMSHHKISAKTLADALEA